MTLLEKNIWKLTIRIDTKVRLCKVYVLPLLMYGSEAWSVIKTLAQRLAAFDSWSLHKILRIPYTTYVTNTTVRQTTGCCPFIGCDRPVTGGKLVDAHFHLVEGINSDVQSVNIGIHSAWRKASEHTLQHSIKSQAT